MVFFLIRYPIDEAQSEADHRDFPVGSSAPNVVQQFFIPSGIVPLRRLQHSWQRSGLLLWESVLFYITIGILEILGIDQLLTAFQGEVRTALSGCQPEKLTQFKLQYEVSAFPFRPPSKNSDQMQGDAFGDNLKSCSIGDTSFSVRDCHLLCMASMLVYEEASTVGAVLSQWGCNLHGGHSTPASFSKARYYVPDIAWSIATTDNAVIVSFRGANPFTQVSRKADIPTAKSARPGMGQVLDGFYRGLFLTSATDRVRQGSSKDSLVMGAMPVTPQSPGDINSGGNYSEYDRLHAALESLVSENRKLYLTGHSIGAAMATLFAMGLHVRSSQLAGLVAGIVTFGQPRIGDATFSSLFNERFGGRALRFQHGSDMVSELPTTFAGFCHTGSLVHLSSWPLGRHPSRRILVEAENPAGVAECVRLNDTWAPLLTIAAALHSLWTGKAAANSLIRLAFAAMPGIADHYPVFYAEILQNA